MPRGSTRPPSKKRRKYGAIARSEKMAGKRSRYTEVQATRQRKIEDTKRKARTGRASASEVSRMRDRQTQQNIDDMARKRRKRATRTEGPDLGPTYDRKKRRYTKITGGTKVNVQKHGKRPKRKKKR